MNDPWAVVPPTRRTAPPGVMLVAAVLTAAALGSVGPIWRVVDDGPDGRRGAMWLGLTALALAAALRTAAKGRLRVGPALGVGVAVAGAVLTEPLIGRAPIALVVVGVVLADSVLGWPPLLGVRWWQHHGPATLAVPVMVASQVVWIRAGTLALVAGLLGLATVLTVLHRRDVGPVAAWGAGLQAGLVGLGSLVGTVAVGLVALPTLYLPGAAARLLGRLVHPGRRWDDARTNWVTRALAEVDRESDAIRPFSSAPRDVRVRRNAVGVVVLVAVVAVAYARTRPDEGPQLADDPIIAATGTTTPEPEVKAALEAIEAVPYSDRPAFEGVPFADDLQAELRRFRLEPSPVGGYGLGEFSGRYTNVAGGERRSLDTTCDDCPRVTLWLAGGSAAFGMGQRDDHTIASELVRLAESDGIALEVHNLGVPGWTLWQEYQGVLARLALQREQPDLLLFYDGYNDVAGTIVESTVHGPRTEQPAILDPDDARTFIQLLGRIDGALDGQALGELAAKRYESLRALIATHAESLGVETHFFFQPDALTSSVQRAPVDELYRDHPQSRLMPALNTALEVTASALSPEVHDLRHLFDSHPRPVFADTVHTNEEGASVVAVGIYERIAPALRARAR